MRPRCILGAPVLVIVPPRSDGNTQSEQAHIVCLVKYTYNSLKLLLSTWYFHYFFFYSVIMIGEVKFCKQFSTNGFSSGPIECDDFLFFFYITSLSSPISDPEVTCWDKWVRDRRCWKLLSHIQAYILTLLHRFEGRKWLWWTFIERFSPPKKTLHKLPSLAKLTFQTVKQLCPN